jgi:DNA-binding MarR family transcriptional regulator
MNNPSSLPADCADILAGLPRRADGMPDRDHHLGYLLKQVHHLINTTIEARMRAHGLPLTFPRAVTLMGLLARPGMSGAELAREAMVSPQTMHQILHKLREEGLITRRADPHHKRVQRTEITEAGQALLLRGIVVADGVFEDTQRTLGKEQRAQLVQLLGVCRDNLLRGIQITAEGHDHTNPTTAVNAHRQED